MCELRGCCSFPHDKKQRWSVWTLLASILAYVAVGNSTGGCIFFEVDIREGPLSGVERVGYGSFDGGNDYQCDFWKPSEREYYFDSNFGVVAGFVGFGSLAALIATIVSCVIACCSCNNRGCFKLMSGFYGYCAITCLLSYIGFSSEFCDKYNCSFGIGAGVAIPAFFLCIAASFLFYQVEEYDPGHGETDMAPAAVAQIEEQNPPPGSVQISQETMPDGSKKTIRKTVNADGSITVEETVEIERTAGEPTTNMVTP